jgi:alpha-aminoadipate carrier protein LysW
VKPGGPSRAKTKSGCVEFKEGRVVAYCPECEAELELDDVEKGDIVNCPECGADLEVVGTDPVELELSPEEEEEAWE